MTENTPNRFLLVDQDIVLRKLGQAFLREMGYKDIFQARTGTEAWSTIKNSNVNFVVSAWNLPDMSGLSLLKIIRADVAISSIPYLLVADEITKSEVIEAGESGVSGIITQPLTPKAFKKKIDQIINQEKDPKAAEFNRWYDRGRELMDEEKFEEALSCFERLLTIYESAEIYYNVGYIKTAQGRYEEAIMAFQRATRIDNSHAFAYHKMGEVYSKLGRNEDANECFQKAADIYLEKSMDKNAEKVLLEAVKINPNTLNVFNSLGILYRRQSKFQEAIRAYRRALKINPQDENIHYNLAKVYLSVDNFQEAVKVLVQAVQLNPGFSEARDLLDSIRLGIGLK